MRDTEKSQEQLISGPTVQQVLLDMQPVIGEVVKLNEGCLAHADQMLTQRRHDQITGRNKIFD